MLKIRLQGTMDDINWFHQVLKHTPEVELIEISPYFRNKGTNRYFRVYAEAVKADKKEDKRLWEK